MGRLQDKVTIVTGAGSGIGKGIAQKCATEGALVVVTDMNGAAAHSTADEIGGRATAYTVDVTDRGSVDAMVAAVVAAHGRIDALVNNAGWDVGMPFVDTDPAFWDKVIAINYRGVLTTCHAVLPVMAAAGRGSIVNLASDAGRVGSSGEAVYAGAKAGVIGFSKTIAREHARHGINVNVVCPGPTDTALFDGYKQGAGNPEKLLEAFTRSIPLGRIGQPDDLPGAILYFASDDARYVTGQVLSISGGLTMAG